MDVSRSGGAVKQRTTIERDLPPRWSTTVKRRAESSCAAVRPSVVRLNVARLVVAVSVVALLTALLSDPTRVRNGMPRSINDKAGTAVAGAAVTPAPAPAPHLVVDAVPAGRGDGVPLGVSVEGPSDGVVLELTGLPSGWRLSSGRPMGSDGWRLPAADLAQVVIRPPQAFVGAVNLAVDLRLADDTLADRQIARREWAPRHTPTDLTMEEIGELSRRGEELLSAGDVASARLMLERAARTGDSRAVFILGTTYDPSVLEYLGVRGVPPDVTLAGNLYAKARELGYTKAPRLVGSLAVGDRRTVGAASDPRTRPVSE